MRRRGPSLQVTSLLRQIYGDYMVPPPSAKRQSMHHHFFVDMGRRLTIEDARALTSGELPDEENED